MKAKSSHLRKVKKLAFSSIKLKHIILFTNLCDKLEAPYSVIEGIYLEIKISTKYAV